MDEALEIHIREVLGDILTGAHCPMSEIQLEEAADAPGYIRTRVTLSQRRVAGGVPYFQVLISIEKARDLVDKPEAERVTYAAMVRDSLLAVLAQAERAPRRT